MVDILTRMFNIFWPKCSSFRLIFIRYVWDFDQNVQSSDEFFGRYDCDFDWNIPDLDWNVQDVERNITDVNRNIRDFDLNVQYFDRKYRDHDRKIRDFSKHFWHFWPKCSSFCLKYSRF